MKRSLFPSRDLEYFGAGMSLLRKITKNSILGGIFILKRVGGSMVRGCDDSYCRQHDSWVSECV